MKKAQYQAAADLVNRYYHRELREMAEKLLATETNRTQVFGHNIAETDEISDILEEYSHRLWQASASISYLRQAGTTSHPPRVARVVCNHNNIEEALSNWFAENAGASIHDISIIEHDENLHCIITHQCGC